MTLSGTVDSRDAKRRAEDIAESVPGVQHVQNNLRVSQGSGTSSGSGFGSTTGTSSLSGTGSSGDQLDRRLRPVHQRHIRQHRHVGSGSTGSSGGSSTSGGTASSSGGTGTNVSQTTGSRGKRSGSGG